MQVIKNQQLIDDSVQIIDAEQPLPQEGEFIAPLSVWLENKDNSNIVGVALTGDDDLEAISGDLERLRIIALCFPVFRDGRAYSMARSLRQNHGYQGELRAVGEVHRDQLYYMSRVGFDCLQLPEGRDAEAALTAFKEISVQYQSSSDQPLPLYRRRSA